MSVSRVIGVSFAEASDWIVAVSGGFGVAGLSLVWQTVFWRVGIVVVLPAGKALSAVPGIAQCGLPLANNLLKTGGLRSQDRLSVHDIGSEPVFGSELEERVDGLNRGAEIKERQATEGYSQPRGH